MPLTKQGVRQPFLAVIENVVWIYSRDDCGLTALGRLIDQIVPSPTFRKRAVFVVGCKQARRQILSSILGCSTVSDGLPADFHVYSKIVSDPSGAVQADNDFVSGSLVLRDLPGWARLNRHIYLQGCVKSECREFPSPLAECLIVVEAPDIQGVSRNGRMML